jgi:hypothetical protein
MIISLNVFTIIFLERCMEVCVAISWQQWCTTMFVLLTFDLMHANF